MEGVSQQMIDREIADVHAEKPVAEKPTRPGRPRNSTTKAEAKPKAGTQVYVLLNTDKTYELIEAADLEAAGAKVLQNREIYTLVKGVKIEPKITF
jgi:hypothetical protein